MTKPKGVFKKRVNKGNRFYKFSNTAIQNLGLAGQSDASFQTPSQGPSLSYLDRPRLVWLVLKTQYLLVNQKGNFLMSMLSRVMET